MLGDTLRTAIPVQRVAEQPHATSRSHWHVADARPEERHERGGLTGLRKLVGTLNVCKYRYRKYLHP